MLASCKQIKIDRGSDPHALLAELEAAGIRVVESVASVGDYTIVAVRDLDHTDEIEARITAIGAAHASEPHPVVGAIATNHALFARRFPPVEPAPPVKEALAAARTASPPRARRRPT